MKNNSADNMYKEIILENYRNPNNFGELKNKTHYSKAINSSCGDEISIDLLINKEKIKDIKFTGKSCAICTASASLLTEFVKNKNLDEVNKLTKKEVLKLLNIDVVPIRLKCALLPLEAIKRAIQ